MAKITKEYNADSIELVQNIDHIRARPAMYVADLSTGGIHQLVKEIVDNCVDEYMAGHVDEVSITLNVDDGTVSVVDNGRGIPVDKHKKSGMSALSTVFMMTGAGGKFGTGAYKTSAGLHGVGVTVVTALSEWLDVWSVRSGKAYHLRFENGVCKNKNCEPDIDTKVQNKSGVVVSFKPDSSIFKKVKLNPDTIKASLKELSYLCSGLTINYTVVSLGASKKFTFKASGGLAQMLQDYTEGDGIDPLHEAVTYSSPEMEVALFWSDSAAEDKWHVFCNSSYLPEGGTPVTGLKRVITNLIGSKSPKPIEHDDVRLGLHVALHVKLTSPEFAGQAKRKLLNRDVEKQVYDEMYPIMETFCQKNPKIVENILKRAAKLKTAREKFEKEREATKNLTLVSKSKRGILPSGFAEAPNCKPEDRELYIVEGESAGGSAKQARYASHQEILALKGKIPNAMQKTRAQLLENEEIQKMITCISAGIEENCKTSRSRVGKILLLMDADPDGSHITSLVLSFFVKYMRPIVDSGMLYVVDSPLFKAEWRGKDYYGDTRQAVLTQLPKNAAPLITRFKGHGECVAGTSVVSTNRGLLPIKDMASYNWSFDGVSGSHHLTTPSVTSKTAKVEELIVTEDRKLFEVTTRYGYSITCTDEHKFICFDKTKGRLIWKPLKDISPGEFIALDRTPVWPVKPPVLTWTTEPVARCRKFAVPEVMTPELSRLLGYLIGDGSFNKTEAEVCCGLSEETASDVAYCFETCFPGVHARKSSYTTNHGKTAWKVKVVSKFILTFLYEACGLYPTPASGITHVSKTYHKRIPQVIMESTQSLVVEFLRGYFESDGSCTNNKVECYSASAELIRQLRILLLKFGIITKGVFEQKTNPFTGKQTSFGCQLYMEGESAHIFQTKIGFVSSNKNSKYVHKNTPHNTNVDVIPGLKDYILDLRDKFRVGKNSHKYVKDGTELLLDLGFSSIAKNVTYTYLEKNRHLVANVGKLDAELEAHVLWLLDRRPFWDSVVSIIPVSGKQTVYDIQVPEGHSYVVDGFITHNSPWQDLRYYAMADTRKLLKVTCTEETDTVILQTMGQDSNFRKTLLGL